MIRFTWLFLFCLWCPRGVWAQESATENAVQADETRADDADAGDLADPETGAVGDPYAVEEAISYYRRGLQLFEEGDFRGAAFEFRRAYAAAPNYRVLYNLGIAYINAHQYADALRTLNQYLEEGGEAVPPDRKAEVDRELSELQTRVGYVTVATELEGATVLMDGKAMGTTPLSEPLVVDLGEHRFELQHHGRRSPPSSVLVAPTEQVTVALEAPPERQVSVVNVIPSAEEEVIEPPFSEEVVWGVAGGALAVGVAAAVFAGLTASERSTLSDLLDTYPAAPDEVDAQRDTVRGFAIATDVAIGAAVVTGALAVTFYLLRDGSLPEEESDDSGSETEEPVAHFAPTGLTLQF